MTQSNTIKLTQFSKSSGCGCKIAPNLLHEILKTKSTFIDTKLLVGNSTNDDAAILELENEKCLISTTDFFMPIVDSPYDFGKISAVNAISDVYAMGGKPLMALAILGWPTEKLGVTSAQELLEGAREICNSVGIALAGGHSIESTEPIFGLSVNGIITKKNIKTNNGIKENNSIYLTKKLGTGVYSTALKRGLLKEEDYNEMLRSMLEINSIGYDLGQLNYVTAMTDVTGFGFLGHLLEMIENNNLTAEINKSSIKTFSNLKNYTSQFIFPDNTTRNFNAYEKDCNGMVALDFINFCDPQTSGGLLFSIDKQHENDFENWLQSKNKTAIKIGETKPLGTKKVEFI